MDIYIKPIKKAAITSRKIVYLKDIAEVFSSTANIEEVKNTIVLKIKEDSKKTYLVSVMDVIKALTNKFQDYTICNVGEMDIVVEYSPVEKKDSPLIENIKVVIIFIILFAGAATAIMSFHSDAEISDIFKNYYYIFFRESIETPKILLIPYSIGLGTGIIVFFNHFSKIFLTQDPTPIEIEMTTYENETLINIVETLSKGKESGDRL